ncbi:hypothetical protein HK097_010879 [Rhizophlyctis rosea]|uniref:BTB domain-containing protein n=1 Tax=Rhizophlyctis rosea TaxID=64517 RepID=A0AAD5SA96_9FUNG|nr:hypothetical protein HK097_010879 [Rhizophlyctis rosea]
MEGSIVGEVLGHTAILMGDEVANEIIAQLGVVSELGEVKDQCKLTLHGGIELDTVRTHVEAVYGTPLDSIPPNIRPSLPPLNDRLAKLLSDGTRSDVQLVLDSPITTPSTLPLHRFVLAVRIPYFTALLTSTFADSTSPTIHLDSTIITPETMHLILQYAYTSTITFPCPLQIDTLILLYSGADYLGMTNLCTYTITQIYTLSHDLSCACTSCILLLPSIASFARSRNLPCLETDCRFVMVKAWDRCIPQRGFAELDLEVREEVILGILEKVTVGGVLEMLKQCRIVEKKVEGVTVSWGNTVRSIVTRVQDRVNELIMERFPSVCRADVEFRRCCENQHWGADLVEEVLGVALKGLNEGNAVEVLLAVMDILKRVESMGTDGGDTPLVRAKRECVEFVARKWWSIQQRGLFRDLSDELLVEIAAGIKLDPDTLRNGLDTQPAASGLIRGAETRTKLRPMINILSPEPTTDTAPS